MQQFENQNQVCDIPLVPFEEATGDVFSPLSNDILFHVVLQRNKVALKGLLCSLLALKPETIKNVVVENPIDYGETLFDKKIIMDTKILLNDDTFINIEIQNHSTEDWSDRAMFYACRGVATSN